MSKLVTIYGGSGFIGRYVARRMAQQGWRVRVATRRPNDALFVKTYGVVGQVEPVFCNVRDDASVRAVMMGADAVVNCVGVLAETGANSFDSVQTEGAGRIARIATELGVDRLVHVSAIGANAKSNSDYARTKAEGEAAVLAAYPDAVILRPSIVFGDEDKFFNRFAGMTVLSPILLLVGGNTKFQPVYVDDVAQAAVKGALGEAEPGTYELGGPEVATFREHMRQMLAVIQRKRGILNLPFFIGRIMAFGLDALQFVTLGLVRNTTLTRDQVKNLAHDNVVAPHAKGLSELGITAASFNAVAPEYLWRYRPSGQYAAIRDSAKNLRKA